MKMKKFLFLCCTVLMMAATSCSSGSETKMINPTSTEFSYGELAKYVTVVDQPAELTHSERDGNHYISLKVTFKLTKEGFKGIDAQDIHFYRLMSVANVQLYDELGNEIHELDLNEGDVLKLKKLLTGNVGDTVELSFSAGTWTIDAYNWYKSATQFAPHGSGDPKANTSTNQSETDVSDGESDFGPENVILPSQLKGKVEVISAEKSVASYGYPAVSVTFKLLSKVSTSSMCSQYGQMWIIGVGQNENGVDVKELLPDYREWRSGDRDGSEFKQFLEGDPDDTITLEFTGDKENSDDVSADLNKVKKFKLKITND